MRILLFCDDEYHPGDIPAEGVKFLGEKGFGIDVVNNTSDFNAEILGDYCVVIMSKADHISQKDLTSWKSDAVQKAFVEYVEKGGGFIVTHSGTVRGANTDVLDKLAGCRFASHPNNSPVMVGAVKPHPITKDVGIFTETDEHYHLDILSDDVDILAASYAGAQGDTAKYESEPYFNYPAHIAPSVLVRTQGKGRVAVLTPGHSLEVWLNPEFQKLLYNTVLWCKGD